MQTKSPAMTVMERLSGPSKSPEALLADALKSFTQAEAKLDAAVEAVGKQQQAMTEQRAALDQKISEANSVTERLTRIKQRITDMLA